MRCVALFVFGVLIGGLASCNGGAMIGNGPVIVAEKDGTCLGAYPNLSAAQMRAPEATTYRPMVGAWPK